MGPRSSVISDFAGFFKKKIKIIITSGSESNLAQQEARAFLLV